MRDNMASQSTFGMEDEVQNQQIHQIKERWKAAFIALLIFSLLAASLTFYRHYFTAHIVQDGLFYQHHLLSLEIQPFEQQAAANQKRTGNQFVINKKEHTITRQQLRHWGWVLLHLMTGSFPQQLDQITIKQWNVFLTLYAHFHPNKLFSKNFLKLLKEVGPFQGKTKEQLMVYLCDVHNMVNKKMNKDLHNCTNIKFEWDTTGNLDQF